MIVPAPIAESSSYAQHFEVAWIAPLADVWGNAGQGHVTPSENLQWETWAFKDINHNPLGDQILVKCIFKPNC